MGVFLVKYKIEFILLMPFVFLLFCYYIHIAHKPDSAAQKPEKLFQEKGLMLYVAFLILLFLACLKINLPAMEIFTLTNVGLVEQTLTTVGLESSISELIKIGFMEKRDSL